MDGSESVRSTRSERSMRSHHSNHRHGHNHSHGDSQRHHRRSHRHRHNGEDSNSIRLPDENRSVSIRLPLSEDTQRLTKNDHVQVQIMPQEDNWPDNTTAVTSETGWSEMDDHKLSPSDVMESSVGLRCTRYSGAVFAGFMSVLAFLSPIAMIVLPRVMPSIQDRLSSLECSTACEGYFISYTFRLLLLALGSWALFFRQPKANMPRLFVFRAVSLFLLFILTFAYWLFYTIRIIIDDKPISGGYESVVLFASSMVDSLLFLHYITIVLIEIRHLRTVYSIKIIRSPDGESRTYSIGQLSIQRAAISCLEWYYRDFVVYNPYLENAIHRKSNKAMQSNLSATKFKIYDVDGPIGGPVENVVDQKSKAIFAAAARRRDSGHNERYYEEQEYERRVAKRRTRLVTAAEESFTHIKRLRDESSPASPMDSMEAAQAIFPSMSRALQKFLRITRQQPAYQAGFIIDHLSRCISNDMSSKAFLEEFIHPGTVINHPKQSNDSENWSLVSDTFISKGIDDGTQFLLKKSDISLLCIVKKMPYFNLSEQVLDSKEHKFVLRLNSETSV